MTRGTGAAVVAAVLVLSGCSSLVDTEAAEAALDEHFLAPLSDADMTATVERRCRLGDSGSDSLWHVETRISVDAAPARVADTLAAEGVVLVRDREPMVVQQEPGDPSGGWNGALESVGDGARLGLTFNNVEAGGANDPYAEVCPAG